jgi:hypothetical protein
MSKNTVTIITAMTLLAACGNTMHDSTLSDATSDPDVGTVITGSVVGGEADDTAGGFTKDWNVNLGEPLWI